MPDKSLEDRLRAVEDHLEILNLIASHPPSADTGSSEFASSMWAEDGVFDQGGTLRKGKEIASFASPQFQKAMEACKALNPASVAPSDQAQHQAALVQYAKCMRAHGVPDFPDPSADGSFDVGGINPDSPQVQKADKACSSPGVGLFQPQQVSS